MTKNAKPRIAKRAAARVLCGLGVACALTGSVPVEALALTSSSTSSVTVSGLANGKVVFSKVVDVNWDATNDAPKDPMYTWSGSSLQTWVRANFPSYIDASGNVTDTFKSSVGSFGSQGPDYTDNTNYTAYDAFYSKLAKAISDGAVTGLAQQTVSGASSVTQPLSMGLWLGNVTDGASVWRPVTVNMVPVLKNGAWAMPDAYTVTAKGTKVTTSLTGSIAPAQVASDQTVTFKFSADMPRLPESAVDGAVVMSLGSTTAGLKCSGSSKVTAIGTKPDGTTVAIAQSDLGTFHTSQGNGRDVVVAVKASVARQYKSIELKGEFTFDSASAADVVSAIPSGGTVKGEAFFATDPHKAVSSSNVVAANVTKKAHTYGADVRVAVPAASQNASKAAQFKVKDGSGAELKFVKAADGSYVKGTGSTAGATLTVATASGSYGQLKVHGLAPGTYTLEQVRTEPGLLTMNPVSFTVSDPEVDGTVQSPSDNKGLVRVDLAPRAGLVLPGTGGDLDRGIAAGLGLLGGSLAVMAVRNKAKGKKASQ